MIRQVSAVALALALAPAPAAAQTTTVLTVSTPQADVRRSPSVASVVVGEATRGSVLEVTREVGDWVKVSWPNAPDGVGYVRLSAGSLSTRASSSTDAALASAGSTGGADAPSAMSVRAEVQQVERRILSSPQSSEFVMPPANRIGFGGMMTGSTIGFGFSGRAWTRLGLGLQAEVSRYSLSTTIAGSRMVSSQFAPSVLYSLPESFTDYVRLRPYVGGGPRFWRSSLQPDGVVLVSETRRSWQVFGGAELTMASAPRFAFSADLRYDSSKTPFAGITFGGLAFAAAGHWYVR